MKKASISILAAAALLFLAGACGGGTDCGDGTKKENGKCVPDTTACSPGTHLSGGVCVADEECGPGTHADTTGTCVPDVACGPGTRADSTGKCVPDCGAGTVVDTATGKCVPAFDDVCGEGTVYDETTGGCLPDYDSLCPEGTIWDETAQECGLPDPDVLEGPEDNNEVYGGLAKEITLPAVGSTLVVGGTITKPGDDNNDDGAPDPDWDVFQFNATKGQVLRFEGTSGGLLPSVAFVVTPPDLFTEAPTSLSPMRIATATEGRNPARTLRIIEDGVYFLVVSDKDNFYGTSLTGGEGMDYLVGISALATPADVDVALGDLFTVDLEDPPAVFNVTGITVDSIVQVTVEDASSTATTRYLYMLDGDGDIAASYYDQVVLWYYFPIGSQRVKATQTTQRLFLEYGNNLAGDESYDIQVEAVPVTEMGTASTTQNLSQDDKTLATAGEIDTYRFTYTAPGSGTALVKIGVGGKTPSFPAFVVIRDDDYKFLASGTDTLSFAWTTGGSYYVDVMFGGETFAGPYTYDLSVTSQLITNTVTEASGNNNDTAHAQALDIATLPMLVNGAVTPAGDADYYSIVPAANVTLTMTVSSATLDTMLYLHDNTGAVITYADRGWEGAPETLTYGLTGGATYYVRIKEYSGSGTGSYQLLLTL